MLDQDTMKQRGPRHAARPTGATLATHPPPSNSRGSQAQYPVEIKLCLFVIRKAFLLTLSETQGRATSTFVVAQTVKNLPVIQETWIQSLDR